MHKPMVVMLTLLAGMFVFLMACQKEYSVEVTKIGAEGSLQDSTGNCLQDSVVGTYYGGVTPGRDTAYLQVKVNVTKTGSYTIYSDKQNGMSFSDSGYFSATGLTTIMLKPIGSPILPGSFDYNVTFDSTVCYFTLAVQDSTGTGLGGGSNPGGGGTGGGGTVGADSWQFTTPAGTYTGSGTGLVVAAGGINLLGVSGANAAQDTLFSISIQISGATPPSSGTFNTNSGINTFSLTAASSSTTPVYQANPTTSGVNVATTITSYDAATKRLKGTFSGTAKDKSGNNVNITNGSFDVTIQ